MALAACGGDTYAGQVQGPRAPREGRPVLAQSGLSAPRPLRPDPPLHAQVPRHVRAAAAARRAHHRPPPRSGLRAAGDHRGHGAARRARARRQPPLAQPVPDRRRGAQLRGQRPHPARHRLPARLGAALRLRHRRAARQRAVAPASDARSPARLRADASLLRHDLRRRRDCGALDARRASATGGSSEAELLAEVARRLAEGRIVGWFQGRFEMGPRALGNRSILADPRDAAHQGPAQRAHQAARALPPVRARRAGRARLGILRDRPARPVHDDGAEGARRQGAR